MKSVSSLCSKPSLLLVNTKAYVDTLQREVEESWNYIPFFSPGSCCRSNGHSGSEERNHCMARPTPSFSGNWGWWETGKGVCGALSSPKGPQQASSYSQSQQRDLGEIAQLCKPLTRWRVKGAVLADLWVCSEAIQHPWEKNGFLNSLALKTPSATCPGKVRVYWTQPQAGCRISAGLKV